MLKAHGKSKIQPGFPCFFQQLLRALLLSLLLSVLPSANGALAQSLPTDTQLPLSKRKPLPLIESSDHNQNATLDLGAFNLSARDFGPQANNRLIKLEATYNESISLKDALMFTVTNNLPIRIAKESWLYQKYQYYANMAGFIPSFNLGYNITESTINPSRIRAKSDVFTAQVTYPVFEGGTVLYNALAQQYRKTGWRHAFESNINDALLKAYNNYMGLLQEDSILRIRSRAARLSKANLALNKAMYKAGTTTQFNVMQSQTQLALDRVAIIQQENKTRQAALLLSYTLNSPLGINLIPQDTILQEVDLVDSDLPVNKWISIAIDTRPELKQYEMFRLAAARNIQTAAASLYPTVSFFTSYNFSNVQDSDDSDSSSTTLENAGVFSGLTRNYQAGFNLTWSLSNMGLLNAANIVSAKALSRQAMMQANQELQKIIQDVRTSYDAVLITRHRIDAAAYASESASKALRLAQMRLKNGLGTNLELIQAQKSYITAIINHAKAIMASNKAQAKLIHASGVISVDTLLNGYDKDARKPIKKKSKFRFW